MKKHGHRDRYGLLLFSIICLFFTSSIFPKLHIIRIVNVLVLGLVLFSIIKLFISRKKHFYIYLFLNIVSVIASLIAFYIQEEYLKIILNVSSGIFTFFILALAIYIINRSLFREKIVTADTIMGSISSFFLIGYLWFMLYKGILFFDPNAFSREHINDFDLVYFSFTTLTTVGYGEITPVNDLAKALANLEAISGLMYPSIIIARLVSLYSNQER